MAKLILEGHNYYSVSIPKKSIYTFRDKYHCRILIDVKSEICCTQIQFISYEGKSDYWTKEELLIAFNEIYGHIKLFVTTDGPIRIFNENLFHPGTEELQTNELKEDFRVEIPEDKENYKKLNTDLIWLKEVQINFDKCKDKLFTVMAWGPNLLNQYRYDISRIIDYLSSVTNASVVTGPNDENIRQIRGALNELLKRKNTQNSNYKTNLHIAQREIYTLEFPHFFKTDLPRNEINQILEEIR